MARILIKEVESLLETKYHINIKIADADDNLRYHIIGNKIYNNKMLLVTLTCSSRSLELNLLLQETC